MDRPLRTYPKPAPYGVCAAVKPLQKHHNKFLDRTLLYSGDIRMRNEEKIIHIDALTLYNKCTDIFDVEDVPEAERIDTARQVADQILSILKGI